MEISVASPERIREIIKNQKAVAIANIKKLKLESPMDTIKSFLRPYLSERLPISGEKINCISAKTNIKNPNPVAPTPNDFEIKGRRGITIAYPVASIKTVKRIIDFFRRLDSDEI
jgi:hypothetical protein